MEHGMTVFLREIREHNRLMVIIAKEIQSLAEIMREREASDPLRKIERMMAEPVSADTAGESLTKFFDAAASHDIAADARYSGFQRGDQTEDEDLPASERWRLGE